MNIYPTLLQTEFYTPERCHITEIFNVTQHSGASIDLVFLCICVPGFTVDQYRDLEK